MRRDASYILAGQLLGAWFLFGFSAFLPVPVETWFAISGITLFCVGLLCGFTWGIQAIITLASAKRRQVHGVISPILTILIAGCGWAIVLDAASDFVRVLGP